MSAPVVTLPPDFQFSQASLQDFVDCALRFYLRHVRRVAWPAVAAEPIEEHERRIQQGQLFHRLVQQHLLGLPEERLTRQAAADPDLDLWWRNYLAYRPAEMMAGARYPESILVTALAGQPLMAKYDLLLIRPGEQALIFDWKTTVSQKPIAAARLREALQTRVYRYVLVQAGAHLNGGAPLAPEQCEMRYWFPAAPQAPVILPYTEAHYHEDAGYLERLIAQILAQREADFIPTEDEMRCRFCAYRSYCARGVQAGQMEALSDDAASAVISELSFDFEQIAEIAF